MSPMYMQCEPCPWFHFHEAISVGSINIHRHNEN